MVKLIKYNAACRALAAARSVDEVKDIHDKATAIKIYAKQAKNKSLEADAFEIRKRAERRLGEIIEKAPKAKGGGDQKSDHRVRKRPGDKTLESQGVDKNLADRARKAASTPRPRSHPR